MMRKQIQRPQSIRRGWSPGDKQYLISHFESTPISVLVRNLNRNEATIRSAAYRWGLKKDSSWTQADEEYLLEHWNTLSSEQIGLYLNRTTDAVNSKYQELKRKKLARC